MTIEASRLRIALQENERWRRTLNVTVPAELVREEQQKAATKLAKQMKLPGFRSGHIPFSVVEKRFGPLLNKEMLDKVVGEAYREALRAEALRPISEGEVSELTWEPEQDLVFSISFDVHPEVDLAQLGGFQVQRPRVEVGEAELERVLTRLREQGATWWRVETGVPQVGDQVSVTVQRLDPGRESDPRTYEVVLGEGNAIPDVETSIATLEPGSTADFTVRFPEDDGSGEEGTQLLRITLLERKIRELPEMDDEFARSVGDFETLDALKARLKEDLEREAEAQSEAAVRGQLLDHILQANPFDVPQSMVDGYVDSLLGDTKNTDPKRLAKVRDQLRPEAEHAVKRLLALERTAHTQQLRATALELDERIELIAGKNQISPSEVYARLQKSGQLQTMEREITEEKVFSFLKEQSQIEEPA